MNPAHGKTPDVRGCPAPWFSRDFFKASFQLMRITNPTGFALLFLPCLWGLVLGHPGLLPPLRETAIYLGGAWLMRSAGCIYNDWVDHGFDRHVKRCQNRPLAAGSITFHHATFWLVLLLGLSLWLLFLLPLRTLPWAMAAVVLVACYPWAKRVTNLPQIVLGCTFSMGFFMALTSLGHTITWSHGLIYLSGISWTVFFDTIYAHQDKEDDRLLALGSTTQLFPGYPRAIPLISLAFWVLFTTLFGLYNQFSPLYHVPLWVGFLTFSFLLIRIDIHNPKDCFSLFKRAQILGWLQVLAISLRFV